MSAMKTKQAFLIPILFFTIALSATYAQQNTSPLNIAKPPSGKLSKKQLRGIAEDIRSLESHPYASDAKQARGDLFKWISGSPDINVRICADVVGPLVNSDYKYRGDLLTQYVLSSAAYAIEHWRQRKRDVPVTEGGIMGAITMYRIIKKTEGDSAEDKFMERMITLSEQGELTKYVRRGIKGCR